MTLENPCELNLMGSNKYLKFSDLLIIRTLLSHCEPQSTYIELRFNYVQLCEDPTSKNDQYSRVMRD